MTAAMEAYERGELNQRETLKMFASLVKSKLAWTLPWKQYGYKAKLLIQEGYLSNKGEILRHEPR